MKIAAQVLIATVFALALFGAGWLIGSKDDTLGLIREFGLSKLSADPEAPADLQVEVASFEPLAVTPPGSASILLVGDVLPLQDRDYLTHASGLTSSADVAIGNLECPLSTHGRPSPLKFDESGRLMHNEFIFRAPPSQSDRLAAAGFDGMTLANNHIMDYGAQALLETVTELDEAGIKCTGSGRDRAHAREPMVFEVEEQTLAMLAYVSVNTLPGTDHFAATKELAGTVFVRGDNDGAPTEQTRQMLTNDIRRAKEKSDFLIVAFHWGTEAKDAPGPLPRHLAHLCVDAGADMVIGHHPHKLQGIEIYKGQPIAYSLGNFVFPTPWKSNHFSAALELGLKHGRWERVTIHPVKLRFKAGDPAPAQGADLHHIVSRVTRLTRQLGTDCVLQGEPTGSRIVIENTAAVGGRTALLKREEQHFFSEPHHELDGMSTAHFLAWDVSGDERVPRERTVVVKTSLAHEVVDIFREIYLSRDQFPIHDLVGYNYRTVAGGSGLSNHALGRAIDINRVENPMIEGGEKIVHPDEPPYEPGEWRPGEEPYSITPDGPVVNAFKSRGWRWGGDWYSCKDYQHFDKPGG